MNLSSDLLIDLVINIASIVVLFLIVRKLAYKPVKKYMTERAQRITSREADAEKLAESAREKEAQYSKLLEDSESVKSEAVRKAEDEARLQSQKIIGAANEKAAEIIAAAEKKSSESYEKMLEEGRGEMIDLSINMTSKLLEKNIDAEDNRKAAEAFLDALDGDKDA